MLERGSILEGRYVVLKEIRRGPTNVAYLGHLKDVPSLLLAIKVIPVDAPTPEKLQQMLERFRLEAERCVVLDHPNLAKVQDFFVQDNNAYLVADYVVGRPLHDMLSESQGLPLAAGLALVHQLCDAIEYCHAQSPPVIVHAVQPRKIIVTADSHIKIVDFGQSWADSPGSHATDYLNGIGSHGYSPIERYVSEHSVDRVSDVYALGATMYTMFSGIVPPAAVELITGQVKLVPLDSLSPDVPSALARVVTKAMAIQKSGRFQSIAQLRAELDHPTPVYIVPPFVPAETPAPPVVAPAPAPAPAPPQALPHSASVGVESAPPRDGGAAADELRVRRPDAPAGPKESPSDELAVRRVAPPAPAPRPVAPAPAPGPSAAPATAPVELPHPLRSGPPPVTAVLEQEGKALHLFGPKEIERIPIDVLHIGPDTLQFASRRTFKNGIDLKMRLGVPLVVTGQLLASEAIVTIQSQEEKPDGTWHYVGTLQIPARLRPILLSLQEQERRVARRFRSAFRVLSKVLKSYQATALDISATGFGFVSDTSFRVGDVQEFSMDIDDAMQGAGGLKVQGKVVHCDPHPGGGFRVGVHFVNLTESVQRPLYHYLKTFHH